MRFDLLVRGGRVVSALAADRADVGVMDGRIRAVGDLRDATGDRVLQAEGCLVLPGGVDPHTHIHWPFLDATTRDDFLDGPIAALHGGTTTIVDWALPDAGSARAGVQRRRQEAEDQKIPIDFSLHCVLSPGLARGLDEMGEIVEMGLPTFKCYLTYRRRGLLVDDGLLYEALTRARSLSAIIGVHAENPSLHERAEAEFRARGLVDPIYFRRAKHNLVEAEAIHKAIFLCEAADSALLVQHVSTREGVDLIREARRRGLNVLGETTPHYLVLTDEVYEREDGRRFICSPPIKSRDDQDALWAGLADGTLSIIGADHAAFSLEDKAMGETAFDVPNGLPGIETRLPLVYFYGVAQGRLSASRFCEIVAENPARIAGLYPRKGAIAVGSDADLVVIDPDKRRVVTDRDLHQASDWTPYEGLELQGTIRATVLRGEIVVEDGRYLAPSTPGSFLPGEPGGYRTVR